MSPATSPAAAARKKPPTANSPSPTPPRLRRLLAAGARFVGKTHTAELAFSLDGRNEHTGTPINPAASDRVPGGSSSGSAAAVAGGLVDIALGSDTGGSVRGPASFCGIIGLRPTHGRVDITGVMPLAPSFDTVGWFARDIEVFSAVGGVLLGEDDDGPALTKVAIAEDSFPFLERGRARGTRPARAKDRALARYAAVRDRCAGGARGRGATFIARCRATRRGRRTAAGSKRGSRN